MKTTKSSIPLAATAAALMALTSVHADTIAFATPDGNLATAANWDGGLKPGAGDVGTIDVNAFLNIGNTLGGWITGDPELIIDSGAVITCSGDWGHVNALSSTVNNGTIDAGDDIFANGSTMTFNAGSATDVNDDFEANGLSILNINGGTHEVGDTFGAQGNNGTTFGTVNLTGGSITAGQFRVASFGIMNLGGSTVLSGGGDTSLLAGPIDISSAWTGSWSITGLSGTDWETAVTAGNWTLDDTTIDATIFATNFVVTNSGTTLALISTGTPPSLVSTSPGNDDTDVPTTSVLVASFDKPIALGATGDVTIKNLDTMLDIVISLPGPDVDGTLAVTGSGTELTITPAAALDTGDLYAIQIGATVVEDLDGLTYEGIDDTTTWSFTTDGTAPVLVSTDPVDDDIDVLPDTSLVATFDEDIVLGTGTITIKNLDTLADLEITVPGPDPDATLTIDGAVLTIDPAVDLVAGDEYAIEISSTAIENLSELAYAGILATDIPNWSFTTDGTPPALFETNPFDDDVNVIVSTDLVAIFDEDIALGTGTITIKNLDTLADIEITVPGPDPEGDGTVTVVDDTLTIDPAADLDAGDEYAIEISNTAVEDLAGNAYEGILSTDDPNWSFTTDGTPPSVLSMAPTAGATDVPTYGGLSLSFGEDVQAGTGTITIHLASDGSVVEAIDVTSGSVSIVGGKVVITPSSDLASSTDFYVTITDGAFTDLSGNTYAGITDPSAWTFTTGSNEGILFLDTFNRADNSDLNASTDGKSGTLGALDWVEVVNLADPVILAGEFKFGETGAGGGWSVAYPDHNFTDAEISAGGEFSVSVDLVNAVSTGGTRFMGIVVGHSKDELDAWTSNNPVSLPFPSDFFIGIDPSGTQELKIFTNGTQDHQTGFTLAPTQTLKVEFTSITNFNAGSSVSYEAFIDDTSIHTGTFTWSGTNENYLGLYSNYTQNQAIMDNFVVRASGVAVPFVLKIAQSGENLDFEWESISGMQYDLLSSTDLATAPSTWLPYNDGVNTYEDIPASGTGTNTLTGVLKDGATRFFAVIEEEPPPLYLEKFENDDGSFTTTGTPNDWIHGTPNSNNNFDLVVTAGNDGSAYCWATNLGDGSAPSGLINTAANSIVRSPDINLTNVTGAQLEFAAAIDAVGTDTFEVLVRKAGTDELLDTITPIPFPATSNWATRGPFDISAGAGMSVYLEFRFQGTNGSYIGAYIDDVKITETTP